MRKPLRASSVLVVVGGLAACAAPRAAFEPSHLDRGVEVSAPVATPVESASGRDLAVAVASFDARLLREPVAAGRTMFLPTSAQGGDAADAPVKPAEPGDAHELAMKLANPIAHLISVPFQSNYDRGIGPDGNGTRYQLNVQPVIPVSLGEDWNLISRTIVPIIDQDDVVPGTSQTGVGDITQSLFFSPKKPTESGWIWGAGPVTLIPTAEDKYLGADKWGAGPTAVVLKQENGWTFGALANHIWSFAGNGDRPEVNTTFVQPFVSYTTHELWTFSVNSESTYNWITDDAGIPVNALVAKLVHIGGVPVQFRVGARYWVNRTEDGPQGLGFRFEITFLFPTGK